MLVLVTYDVSFDVDGGPKRLRQIARICQDYGIRVQYSVFECEVGPAQWVQFKDQLFAVYDEDVDSLRFYMLGKNGQKKVEHHGAKPGFDAYRDPIII